MSNPNLKSVAPMAKGTATTREDGLAKLAALKAQIAALQESMPELDAAEKAKIETLRYDAYVVRIKMEPLEAEYDRISNEYTDIVGSGGVNPDGSRKLAKIKISKDEVKKFAARFAAESKRS